MPKSQMRQSKGAIREAAEAQPIDTKGEDFAKRFLA
jgi:hypothetical protein